MDGNSLEAVLWILQQMRGRMKALIEWEQIVSQHARAKRPAAAKRIRRPSKDLQTMYDDYLKLSGMAKEAIRDGTCFRARKQRLMARLRKLDGQVKGLNVAAAQGL